MQIIEVFQTNVDSEDLALQVIERLALIMPTAGINFDLEDCDCILRINDIQVDIALIYSVARELGISCEVLP